MAGTGGETGGRGGSGGTGGGAGRPLGTGGARGASEREAGPGVAPSSSLSSWSASASFSLGMAGALLGTVGGDGKLGVGSLSSSCSVSRSCDFFRPPIPGSAMGVGIGGAERCVSSGRLSASSLGAFSGLLLFGRPPAGGIGAPNMPWKPIPPLILAILARSSSLRRTSGSISSSSSSSSSASASSACDSSVTLCRSSLAAGARLRVGEVGAVSEVRRCDASPSSSRSDVSSWPSVVSPAPDISASLPSRGDSAAGPRDALRLGGGAWAGACSSREVRPIVVSVSLLSSGARSATSTSSRGSPPGTSGFFLAGFLGFSFLTAASACRWACSCCCLASKAIRSLRLVGLGCSSSSSPASCLVSVGNNPAFSACSWFWASCSLISGSSDLR